MKKELKETIFETYIREICPNCKNKDKDICEIRKNINGVAKCVYYERQEKSCLFNDFMI